MPSSADRVKQLISKLTNIEIQLMHINVNINFNTFCKKEKIVSNYILITIKNISAKTEGFGDHHGIDLVSTRQSHS